MIRNFLTATCLAVMWCGSALQAGITLVDINVNPGTWISATAELNVTGNSDLGSLPDFGSVGIDGPLTSAGSGVIPAGFVPTNITITTDMMSGPNQPQLFGLGPSAGLGNTENVILVNDSADAMVIDFVEAVQAFEFTYYSLFGSGPVTMEVTRDSGFTTFYTGLSAPIVGGNRYGILGNGGEKITSVRLLDLGVGFEGIGGSFKTFAVPEPASLVLASLGLAGCALTRRRRR